MSHRTWQGIVRTVLPSCTHQKKKMDIRHVSGFARIVIREPTPPSGNIWVEDGGPVAGEYWVDETRKAVICAYDLGTRQSHFRY